MMLQHVRKRDGAIVAFDIHRIESAISRAAIACKDKTIDALGLSHIVAEIASEQYTGQTPSVEDIQDVVEQVLMGAGHAKVAKGYILYRMEGQKLREARFNLVGKAFGTKLSLNALTVLRERYLLKDHKGNIIETPDEMFRRVATAIAKADRKYDPKANLKKTEDEFYNMMSNLEFLPNSPTLMNAGTPIQQLSACFVLPIEDNMTSIFETLKHTAIIHKSGGGTGFSFSRIRPRGDFVSTTKGISSGPISFMRVYDAATEMVKQGGRRRGANMAILRVDHPDILEFIHAKEKLTELTNFNVSVAITDDFMERVKKNQEYALINPRNKQIVKRLPAKDVWNLIITMAWKSGEPGIVFIDRMNKTASNPTPKLGTIESTNPCGEVPLLPYESCNLASINLSKLVKDGKIDWKRLNMLVHRAVHFLDNVIDVNEYPIKEIEKATRLGNRKIGLGVMGFADMLYLLKIPYSSPAAEKLAMDVMKCIQTESKNASEMLAKKRGPFPNWKNSIYYPKRKLRNATTTSIAPTGTLSMIADTSPGIEPNYAIVYIKRVMGGQELMYINPIFERIARAEGWYSEELTRRIANLGSIQHEEQIPAAWRNVLMVAYDVMPEWHARIQAAFQRYVDNAVSKTVNFPASATVTDVENVYWLAYTSGCKGVTIYRDQSRSDQVMELNPAALPMAESAPKGSKCPECFSNLIEAEGCRECSRCGFSFCLA
ncbi:adenosylcobalamin-dependent ribonucleoside-diphosphate reductase [Candidatus Woesearchaeota archaeon]|nr:adenosylcobalamin-dependent ribonucleoside-diphosphate reductase [Candidatus Woesearchaeota archaeon]